MNGIIVWLILTVGLTRAQLNFEGNPLTEDTEYTAEETHVSRRTAKQEKPVANLSNGVTAPLQVLSPPFQGNATRALTNSSRAVASTITVTENFRDESNLPISTVTSVSRNEYARNLPRNSYNREINSVNQAELALSSFLNSKTPEESRVSLESYMKTRESPATERFPHSQDILLRQGEAVQQQLTPPSANQQLLQGQMLTQQGLPSAQPNPQLFHRQELQHYPTANQRQDVQQNSPLVIGHMQPAHRIPYAPSGPSGIQARNDFMYPMDWQRFRRIRGRPVPYAQSRFGPPLYKGPALMKPNGPVEIIYTRPPGFHRGPAPISNPPVPYEDASAWFPDADYPPSTKDVYYSQLYAQSYDPHYYNYIAKTGKIRPHLYGKLGKHEEDVDIWTELYRGFKKHGLKNLMTPTFLLGMTLPVVTLMLTALVQKRSLARADSRDLHGDDMIQEYLERAQRAMECYEKKRRKRDTGGTDGC